MVSKLVKGDQIEESHEHLLKFSNCKQSLRSQFVMIFHEVYHQLGAFNMPLFGSKSIFTKSTSLLNAAYEMS